MHERPAVVVRPLLPDDAAGARALVHAETAGTTFAEPLREALDRALEGTSDEARALCALRDGELVGLCLYGRVAGSRAARLHLVAVTASARLGGVARRLCDATAAALADSGAALLVAEYPDAPAFAAGAELLRRAEFVEEGRVRDYFRDGVDLVLFRRELATG